MSEEKKIQRGGVTPEQEDVLKEVAGGTIGEHSCSACAHLGKKTCPFSDNLHGFMDKSASGGCNNFDPIT